MITAEMTCYIGDELPVIVEYTFMKGDKEILNPPEMAQPSSPDEIEISSVMVGDADIMDCLNEKTLDLLEDSCMADATNQ